MIVEPMDDQFPSVEIALNSCRSSVDFASAHQGYKSPVDLSLTRVDLADMFAQFGFTRGAEIGVERGLYSEVLCKANPRLMLWCVDAWQAYSGYREHVSQRKLDGFFEEAKARLAAYPVQFLRRFSADAAAFIPDGSLDFVYIDAAHDVRSVINDLAIWKSKVRPGGIIAGHDYRKVKGSGPFHVPQAIQAWTSAYHIKPYFVLRGDTAPSWFWVQP